MEPSRPELKGKVAKRQRAARIGLSALFVCGPLASCLKWTENVRVAASEERGASGLLITNANNGQRFENLKVSSKTGSCVVVRGAANIVIQNVEIGPCAGTGIDITDSDQVTVYDSYIHTETLSPRCCDNNDGVFVHNGSKNTVVEGNVIAYGESNVEGLGVAGIRVVGNFLLNPRGPKPRGQNFQCYNGCRDVMVSANYALSSMDTGKYLYPENQEDAINFGISDGVVAQDNFITGGHSRSGCGLIADDRANRVQFEGEPCGEYRTVWDCNR